MIAQVALTAHDKRTYITLAPSLHAIRAYLFIRCLHTAGINPDNELVKFQYDGPVWPDGPEMHMFVNDWTFASQSNPDKDTNGDYPCLNLPEVPYTFENFLDDDCYNWQFVDVQDDSGVPGQSESNPASLFEWHAVVLVGDFLYDPSYGGEPYDASGEDDAMLADIDSAMAGYALLYHVHGGLWINELEVMTDLDGDKKIEDTFVEVSAFIIQENPSGNQLKHMPGSPDNVNR